MTAPVIRSAHVNRSPEDAFDIFTNEIGAWWPLPSHGIFGDKSGGISFRDGHIVETSVDGTEATWAEVLVWEPPTGFRLAWHPGQTAEDASEVDVQFIPNGDGTTVIVEHRSWEKFGNDAMNRRRSYVGPNAWGYVLDHFADGAEAGTNPPDLTELAAAYDTLYSLAETGTFGPAPAGEWDADQTLAHVALNDLAMNAVCQGLVHGTDPSDLRFENEVCQDPAVLAAWIESAGDRASLIARGRASATQLQGALRRLSLEQRETMVHCRLSHDGNTMLDDPRPWGAVAIMVQSQVHLPAHIEQLTNLAN